MDMNMSGRPEIRMPEVDDTTAASDTVNNFRPTDAQENGAPTGGGTVRSPAARRKSLMAGGSALALVVTGGLLFLGLHYSTTAPPPAPAQAPRPVAALSAAAAPAPAAQAMSVANVASPASPARSVVRRVPVVPDARPVDPNGSGDDMAAFLQMQHGPDATPVSNGATGARASTVDAVPVSALAASSDISPLQADLSQRNAEASPSSSQPAETAAPDIAPQVDVPLPQNQAQPTQKTPAATPDKAIDAASIATSFKPDKMSEPQQIQVLELVSELGTMVKDERAQIIQLRSDQNRVMESVESTVADLKRRVVLAEARAAVGGASPEPRSLPAPMSSSALPAPAPTPVRASVRASVQAEGPVAEHGNRRYHVQAASPGIAMLSEIDPAGGVSHEIQVSPGSDVPDHGKVISIAQRGTVWLVKTERDVIQ